MKMKLLNIYRVLPKDNFYIRFINTILLKYRKTATTNNVRVGTTIPFGSTILYFWIDTYYNG